MGSKFNFSRQTWLRYTLNIDLSSLNQFKVHFIWVRHNTSSSESNNLSYLPFWLQAADSVKYCANRKKIYIFVSLK